ncbi:hypothetical protein B0I35DRAFT_362193 [Stachybotrys elegans]|uniref:Short-chain dehydrogenase n=1 Tax=Stachybotrys elegans TaxID=80388 RepID=A0A8K0SEQ4_9HYPO|nr:hypothetical protein B0I35DRAFT_362193 [Stachybotrys elegans]
MASRKILLILGAGPGIARGVAEKFKSAGYGTAIVSRSKPADGLYPADTVSIQADLRDASSIPKIFDTVKDKLGGSPSVVVYNAAAMTVPSDLSNPFSVSPEDLERDMAIMNTTPYVAAGQAVAGFEAAKDDTPKAFIYTGNMLAGQTRPVPYVVTLGTGKSAASYWLGTAASFYKDKGYGFYFADERKADGSSIPGLNELSASATGDFYLELAEGKKQYPFHATFVAGQGYVHFPDTTRV